MAPEDQTSEHDVVDDDAHADPDQPDIGTFDPEAEDGVDDPSVFVLEDEIDDLPDVGGPDPDEEPILDEPDDDDEVVEFHKGDDS